MALQVGDRVGYKAAWLKSVGMFTGPVAHAKGTITAIQVYSKQLSVATVDWNDPEVPVKVNTCNLAKLHSPSHALNCIP